MQRLLVLLLVLAAFPLLASPLGKEFETALSSTQNAEQALEVIASYRDRLTDLDDLRQLQNYWMQVDPAGCGEWFGQQYVAHPDRPEYEYLWLRGQTDPGTQLAGGRALIAREPSFYWGYRLFSNTYSQILQDASAPDSLRADIMASLASDRALLLQGLQTWPLDDYLRLALFHHHASRSENDQAEAQLLQLFDPAAIEANFRHVIEFIAATGRVRPFEVLYPRLISRLIARGEVPAADSLAYYQYSYLEALRTAKDWAKMRSFLRQNPDLQSNDKTLQNRLLMHLGLSEPETALNLLEGALAAGVITYPEALDNPDYAPLSTLPRHPEVMALAAANWEQARAERKARIIAEKVSRPAPLWELPDPEGNLTRLEDLRGKIVILDFWALWCSPCLKTLPKLDSWLERNSSEDVALISINVWESPSELPNVIDHFSKNSYGMKLLLGDNELPRAYGFSGIPWLCAIDKQGNIAFTQSGFSPVLEETLSVWVEELRR